MSHRHGPRGRVIRVRCFFSIDTRRYAKRLWRKWHRRDGKVDITERQEP